MYPVAFLDKDPMASETWMLSSFPLSQVREIAIDPAQIRPSLLGLHSGRQAYEKRLGYYQDTVYEKH